MRKVILFSTMMMIASLPMAAKSTKTIRFKVIETSDVHGHFFPYDFMERKPIKGTLVRANTYINKEREKFGKDHLLLIDNGDILQGQPCVYWSNYVMPEDVNLAARVINYMEYDAETVGNHDIEPGHKVYDKWIREVRCPLLGANIVKEGSDGTARKENIYPLHRWCQDCCHRYAYPRHSQLAQQAHLERNGVRRDDHLRQEMD